MMERVFAAHQLEWRYLTLEVSPELLEDAVRGIRALGFRGANITSPHEINVTRYVDSLSEAASLMGAANCIHRQGDQLIAENTNGKGFLESLREVADPEGQRVVVFGAGGAARAIAVELGLSKVAHLTIVNRTESHGQELVQTLQDRLHVPADFERWDDTYWIPDEADMIINATSLGAGAEDERLNLNLESLRPELLVADVVINPPMTWFLDEAKARGCRCLDGLGMLVNQAKICFKIWTGLDADTTVMREAVEEFLEV